MGVASARAAAGLVNARPTIGVGVHYTSYGSKNGEYEPACRAATVTEVGAWIAMSGADPTDEWVDGGIRYRQLLEAWHPNACALKVENPTGTFHNVCRFDVPPQNEDGSVTWTGGTWHWPCGR